MAERRPLVIVGDRVAELPTEDSLPGSGVSYFSGDTTPTGMVEGDTWYKPLDGVKYTYIDDGGSLVWAEV